MLGCESIAYRVKRQMRKATLRRSDSFKFDDIGHGLFRTGTIWNSIDSPARRSFQRIINSFLNKDDIKKQAGQKAGFGGKSFKCRLTIRRRALRLGVPHGSMAARKRTG